MMYKARQILQLATTPAFVTLAAVNYAQPSPLCWLPGPYGFLSSMWFMSLMMALAHSGPWLTALAKFTSKPAGRSRPPVSETAVLTFRDRSNRDAAASRVAREL
jgi:hypothetical protein